MAKERLIFLACNFYSILAEYSLHVSIVGLCFVLTSPDSSVGSVSAWGMEGQGFDPRLRHTKVVKNGTSCSSLGTMT